MNKKLIWIIIIALVILLGIYVLTTGDNDMTNSETDSDDNSIQEQGYSDLDSSESVFQEIDNSLNYIE